MTTKVSSQARINVADLVEAVRTHPLYEHVSDEHSLRLLMRTPVFAVWDFQVKPRRAPAFGPARHWRFAGGAFTPPLTKGMLTPPWNPSIRFPALTGGA